MKVVHAYDRDKNSIEKKIASLRARVNRLEEVVARLEAANVALPANTMDIEVPTDKAGR